MTRHSPGFAPYCLVFHRKSGSNLSSYEGICRKKDCRCHLTSPSRIWYWSNTAPLSCARAYTCVRTREERGTK